MSAKAAALYLEIAPQSVLTATTIMYRPLAQRKFICDDPPKIITTTIVSIVATSMVTLYRSVVYNQPV